MDGREGGVGVGGAPTMRSAAAATAPSVVVRAHPLLIQRQGVVIKARQHDG
jgi:hypothetical protein